MLAGSPAESERADTLRRAEPESVWPPAFWFDPLARIPSAVVGREAMVSTAHPEASIAALEVLREGGSAIDAAISAQLVLNVVEPQSSGIGGGCFLLYLPPGERTPIVIDGRECAPAAIDERCFLGEGGASVPYYPDRVTGGYTVGVPGVLSALEIAHARFGRLPWARLVEPAIRLAEGGTPVGRRLHESIREEAGRLWALPAARALLFHPNGSPLLVGERFSQPELGATMRLVAGEGAAAFYRGELAADVERAVREAPVRPGSLRRSDLAAYSALVREPVRGSYRGIEVFGVGPPSAGGVAIIEALHILEGFDLRKLVPGSADALHLVLETTRLVMADRDATVGDPAAIAVPVGTLTSRSFAARRRENIDFAHAAPSPVAPAPFLDRESQDTTHLSIAAPDGGALAMTSSIEYVFGSGLVVPGRGFFLNNELSDFDSEPRTPEGRPTPNGAAPGKRPRSSMSPTILVRDGRPFLAVGSPGGARIIGVTLGVILNVVDWGMDVQEAIHFPRAYQRGRPASEFESLYFDEERLEALHGVKGTIDNLAIRGHVIEPPTKRTRGVGGVHAILWGDSLLYGGADPRREGVALGY
jgi:gamma-glutamyltranspeptidase/glutathione hydrolase